MPREPSEYARWKERRDHWIKQGVDPRVANEYAWWHINHTDAEGVGRQAAWRYLDGLFGELDPATAQPETWADVPDLDDE